MRAQSEWRFDTRFKLDFTPPGVGAEYLSDHLGYSMRDLLVRVTGVFSESVEQHATARPPKQLYGVLLDLPEPTLQVCSSRDAIGEIRVAPGYRETAPGAVAATNTARQQFNAHWRRDAGQRRAKLGGGWDNLYLLMIPTDLSPEAADPEAVRRAQVTVIRAYIDTMRARWCKYIELLERLDDGTPPYGWRRMNPAAFAQRWGAIRGFMTNRLNGRPALSEEERFAPITEWLFQRQGSAGSYFFPDTFGATPLPKTVEALYMPLAYNFPYTFETDWAIPYIAYDVDPAAPTAHDSKHRWPQWHPEGPDHPDAITPRELVDIIGHADGTDGANPDARGPGRFYPFLNFGTGATPGASPDTLDDCDSHFETAYTGIGRDRRLLQLKVPGSDQSEAKITLPMTGYTTLAVTTELASQLEHLITCCALEYQPYHQASRILRDLVDLMKGRAVQGWSAPQGPYAKTAEDDRALILPAALWHWTKIDRTDWSGQIDPLPPKIEAGDATSSSGGADQGLVSLEERQRNLAERNKHFAQVALAMGDMEELAEVLERIPAANTPDQNRQSINRYRVEEIDRLLDVLLHVRRSAAAWHQNDQHLWRYNADTNKLAMMFYVDSFLLGSHREEARRFIQAEYERWFDEILGPIEEVTVEETPREGDTLEGFACRFDLTLAELLQANPALDPALPPADQGPLQVPHQPLASARSAAAQARRAEIDSQARAAVAALPYRIRDLHCLLSIYMHYFAAAPVGVETKQGTGVFAKMETLRRLAKEAAQEEPEASQDTDSGSTDDEPPPSERLVDLQLVRSHFDAATPQLRHMFRRFHVLTRRLREIGDADLTDGWIDAFKGQGSSAALRRTLSKLRGGDLRGLPPAKRVEHIHRVVREHLLEASAATVARYRGSAPRVGGAASAVGAVSYVLVTSAYLSQLGEGDADPFCGLDIYEWLDVGLLAIAHLDDGTGITAWGRPVMSRETRLQPAELSQAAAAQLAPLNRSVGWATVAMGEMIAGGSSADELSTPAAADMFHSVQSLSWILTSAAPLSLPKLLVSIARHGATCLTALPPRGSAEWQSFFKERRHADALADAGLGNLSWAIDHALSRSHWLQLPEELGLVHSDYLYLLERVRRLCRSPYFGERGAFEEVGHATDDELPAFFRDYVRRYRELEQIQQERAPDEIVDEGNPDWGIAPTWWGQVLRAEIGTFHLLQRLRRNDQQKGLVFKEAAVS